jgi:SAM-dependent methyltransferase
MDEMITKQPDVKQQVREFYDQIGWQQVDAGLYQNARYEDLRPVSQEYIHRCHLRLGRSIHPSGRFFLDAGSGPIQYPEYLEYSRSYQYRVCADISIVALEEARRLIGSHGLFVVADIARLPFKPEAFDGIISLHTIHHLPEDEHLTAYRELARVLAQDRSAAVVYGWPSSRLMRAFEPAMRISRRIRSVAGRLAGKRTPSGKPKRPRSAENTVMKGTFTSRHDYDWVMDVVGSQLSVEIRVWRSVSVRFMRTLIHPWLAGKFWLRLIYRLEERYPQWFGKNGQYPLIVIRK